MSHLLKRKGTRGGRMERTKLLIIGAGIAGTMASNYFASQHPIVIDKREKSEQCAHRAIMRFRDPVVGLLLRARLNRITVTKSIYMDGKHHDKPDIYMANRYSLKVSDGIYERSINNIEPADRYLMSDPGFPSPDNIKGGYRLELLTPDRVAKFISSNGYPIDIPYQECISTIPMNEIVGACPDGDLQQNIGDMFFAEKYDSIYVTTLTMHKLKSNINHTVYFPGNDTTAYRATLEGNKLIIESMDSYLEEEQIILIMKDVFGIGIEYYAPQYVSMAIQAYGKISPIDDDIRKGIIRELSSKYSVYSLGRYATWRNITSDSIINDLDVISRLMPMGKQSLDYQMSLL